MPRRPSLPTLSDSRLLRLVYFYAFYGAQGVSIGLFTFAIPACMAVFVGVSLGLALTIRGRAYIRHETLAEERATY